MTRIIGNFSGRDQPASAGQLLCHTDLSVAPVGVSPTEPCASRSLNCSAAIRTRRY